MNITDTQAGGLILWLPTETITLSPEAVRGIRNHIMIRHCYRCGHVWDMRGDEEPKRCPDCGKTTWNQKEKPKRGLKKGYKFKLKGVEK